MNQLSDSQSPIVEDKKFCLNHIYPNKHQVDVFWKPKTIEMDSEDIKNELMAYAELMEKYHIEKIFVNTIKCYFTLSPALQIWHDEVIVPRYVAAGVRKMAFLQAEDIITQLSHEQAFDEENSQQLQVRFFDEAALAYAWLEEGE